MTKHHDPSSSSSDSTSCSSASDSHCSSVEQICLTAQQIHCMYADAVVGVHSEFILIGASGPTGVTGGTPLALNARADIIKEGNGFFFRKGCKKEKKDKCRDKCYSPSSHSGLYIMTAAQNVLLPPSLSSVAQRFPPVDATPFSYGNIKDTMVRASRILVSVFGVADKKGCKHSYVYEADLIGVDGAGDLAILKIAECSGFNKCQPALCDHIAFKLGGKPCAGDKVYLLGDYVTSSLNRRTFNAVSAIADGIVSDADYADYFGWALQEAVLVTAPAYAFTAGLPMIDCEGRVFAMQTTDLAAVDNRINFTLGTGATGTIGQTEGSGLVAGPSMAFLAPSIKAILRPCDCSRIECDIEQIADSVGSYRRFVKGYAGIAYDIFTAGDYTTTAEFTSGKIYSTLPRIRVSSTGQLLNGPNPKILRGVRVLGLAGANPDDQENIANGAYYVPGGTGLSAPLAGLVLPVSPVLGKLLPGDLITSIGGIPMGDIGQQRAPAAATWGVKPGCDLTFCYSRGGNELNTDDNGVDNDSEQYGRNTSYSVRVGLVGFPKLMDYPWYSINRDALLAAAPYGFVFPAEQVTNPQLPARTQPAGFFHPAF